MSNEDILLIVSRFEINTKLVAKSVNLGHDWSIKLLINTGSSGLSEKTLSRTYTPDDWVIGL